MTEQQWMTTTDPTAMVKFLRDRATDRKLRLFACGVCRRMGYRIGKLGEEAVDVAERFADGSADDCDLVIAAEVLESQAAPVASHRGLLGGLQRHLPGICLLTDIGDRAGLSLLTRVSGQYGGPDLLRDIFGNPFRPVSADSAWLTPTVKALAVGIYEERGFDRLPILADALQEAGCENEDVLVHCRSEGPHTRGCFVVDHLLGRR